ncbi:MAG: hypothetical protein MUE81_07930 [Thermoflexibacter sp.]|jgi:hypothetical protein|nr:hypothetical protein [Thermoflexibacter sp.]
MKIVFKNLLFFSVLFLVLSCNKSSSNDPTPTSTGNSNVKVNIDGKVVNFSTLTIVLVRDGNRYALAVGATNTSNPPASLVIASNSKINNSVVGRYDFIALDDVGFQYITQENGIGVVYGGSCDPSQKREEILEITKFDASAKKISLKFTAKLCGGLEDKLVNFSGEFNDATVEIK